MNANTTSDRGPMASFSNIHLVSRISALLALLTLFTLSARTASAQYGTALKGQGSIQFAPAGISSFAFSGAATFMPQYQCRGEIQFASDRSDGPLNGAGVAVFRTPSGDQLVGLMSVQTGTNYAGQVAFSWRDGVRSSNGTIFRSTGKFATSRPADATLRLRVEPNRVVIAIIAILIGL